MEYVLHSRTKVLSVGSSMTRIDSRYVKHDSREMFRLEFRDMDRHFPGKLYEMLTCAKAQLQVRFYMIKVRSKGN